METNESRPDIAAFRDEVLRVMGSPPDGLNAVVLFGSRARGDHGPDSDWDMLNLWADDDQRKFKPLDFYEGCPVYWGDVTQDELNQRYRVAGSFYSAVVDQGVPLLGHMDVDRDKAGSLPMDLPEWGRWLNLFTYRFSSVPGVLRRFLRSRDGKIHMALLTTMFTMTSDIAELVAKLVLVSKGVQPKKVHDVKELAEQLPASDPMRATLHELNGGTGKGHVAVHEGKRPLGLPLEYLRRLHLSMQLTAKALDGLNFPADSVRDVSERMDVIEGNQGVLEQFAFDLGIVADLATKES